MEMKSPQQKKENFLVLKKATRRGGKLFLNTRKLHFFERTWNAQQDWLPKKY